MTLMSQTDFDQFFQSYAPKVAGFDEASYWRLSDELIKRIVRRHLNVRPGDTVLDAGGGTGRWGLWLAQELGVDVRVADKSPDMLAEAADAIDRAGMANQLSVVQCDLENAVEVDSSSADAILSTYGVLSFLNDPAAFFREMFRILRPGGTGLLMSHSLSNALTSMIGRDGVRASELRDLLRTRVVRWNSDVPPLRVFTGSELSALAVTAGFAVEGVFGVTSVVMPGPEDFGYPYDQFSAISLALCDPEYFQVALELEVAASEEPGWAERGVNLMIKVRRPL